MLTSMMLALSALSVSALERGVELRREGRLDEAIQFFSEALAAQPGLPEAERELGHALALAGRYQDALRAYGSLAESAAPWPIESARWSGLTHLYLGEIDQGLSLQDRETELARGSGNQAALARAAWYRGHILTEVGRLGEASAAFVKALEIAPDDLATLHLAGILAVRQGDTGSLRYQIEDLQQAVDRSGDASQLRRVYQLQAELALLQNQPRKALERIQKANRLFVHPLYRETLARIEMALDRPEAAESAYREIISATDERLDIPIHYVKALLGLARALDARGERSEAATYYRRFLDHWGGAPEILPGVEEARNRLKSLGLDEGRTGL